MRKTIAAHLAILTLLSVLAARPLFRGLAVSGHSSLIDIQRTVQLDALYRAGAPFSIWAPDLYFGRGAPLFRYYAPLPYHAAELLHLSGLAIVPAIKAVYLASFLLAAFGAYRLFLLLRGPAAGLVGGAFYLLAPYRFVNAYVRSALGESLALAILPWLAAALLVAARETDRRGAKAICSGGLLVAALTLAHNLTALLALPAVALLLPFVLPRPFPRGWWVRAAATLVAGVLLAGVYWYPAYAGRNDVWLSASITGGYFDFHRHFVRPSQLLAGSIAFGFSEEGPLDTMPFPAGPLHLAAAAGAMALALTRRDRGERRLLLAGALLTAVALLMTLDISRPLWETVPLLPYVQFPWRFLGLASLGTAWLAATLVPASGQGATARVLTALLTVASLVAAVPWISARHIQFDESKLLTREGIAGRLSSTTAYHDYLPIGVRALPETPAEPRFLVRDGQAALSEGTSAALRHEVQVSSPAGGAVECRVFWFPGWRATWNGEPIEMLRARPEGTVIVRVPPGEGRLVVLHAGDPRRLEGGALSLLGVAMAAVTLLPPLRGKRHAA